jgi:hypothetical protein
MDLAAMIDPINFGIESAKVLVRGSSHFAVSFVSMMLTLIFMLLGSIFMLLGSIFMALGPAYLAKHMGSNWWFLLYLVEAYFVGFWYYVVRK